MSHSERNPRIIIQLLHHHRVLWASSFSLSQSNPIRIPVPAALRNQASSLGIEGWILRLTQTNLKAQWMTLVRSPFTSVPPQTFSIQSGSYDHLFPKNFSGFSLRILNEEASLQKLSRLTQSNDLYDQALITSLVDHTGALSQRNFLALPETRGAMALLGLLLAATWLIPHFFPKLEDTDDAAPPPAIAKILLKPKGGATTATSTPSTASKNPSIAARAATQNIKQLSSTALVQSLKSLSPSLSQFIKRAPTLQAPTQKALETMAASRSLASLAGSLAAGQTAPSTPGAIGEGSGGTAGAKGYGSAAVAGNGLGKGSAQVSIQDLTQRATIEEGLTREEVGRVIHAHLSEIRYCYESTLLSRPNLEGKLTLAFSIRGNGSVATARAEGGSFRTTGSRETASEGSAPQFEDCLIRRLLTWKFPNPKGGVTVAVTYPFVFKSLGQ